MFGIMKQKIVVSNVRFPYQDWMMLKSLASDMDMSTNEYIQYACKIDSVKKITGLKKILVKPKNHDPFKELLAFAKTHKGTPMGANEDDKIIYGID
ncbi:hypothetical protein COT54_00895 [Candidatus Collierbacteria bacterium CG09_land_8_20_14_0_10_46_12]|uniref:Uncharacterized protein n=2 Tax=Candidatus Collieribacteriota TaxID=1752725 RepID=A0A2H0WZU4_9BACT|nr:MAG: hypothetical protein COT54_00895 [Candidatus Collierbacteria bacterium CG09_land_8_20_14_0_10_46_12]